MKPFYGDSPSLAAQTVDLSFNEPPHFDFVAKPIGFDLSIVSGSASELVAPN